MRKLICAAVLAACSLFTPANAAAIKAIGINPSTGQQTQIGGTNTLQAPTPSTANASINLPHGTAPSSPNNGDCWTTTAGLYCRINTVTIGPFISAAGAGTVITTGSPSGGQMAKFSGASSITNAVSGTDYAPATSGASILYGNGAGGFSNVTVGTGLTFSGGTLTNSGSGGAGSWSANPFCSTAGAPNPCIKYGGGAPSGWTDPTGSLWLDYATPALYQQVSPSGANPALVQSAAGANGSATLGATPTANNYLVAFCTNSSSSPTAGAGYTQAYLSGVSGAVPAAGWFYRQASNSESTSQTPCGNTSGATLLFEVSGVTNWAAEYAGVVAASNVSATTITVSTTTTSANTLVLAGIGVKAACCTVSMSGMTTGQVSSTGGGNAGAVGATGFFASNGSAASATGGFSGGGGVVGNLLSLIPQAATVQQLAAISGATSTGNCAKWASAGVLADTGSACAGGIGKVTRIQLHANASIANNSFGALTLSSSDIVQDDVGAWVVGSPTRITTPSGYTKVRITIDTTWASNSVGDRWTYVIANGGATALVEDNRAARNESASTIVSPWLTVTTGDYFEGNFAQTSGGALNLTGATGALVAATRIQFEWAP